MAAAVVIAGKNNTGRLFTFFFFTRTITSQLAQSPTVRCQGGARRDVLNAHVNKPFTSQVADLPPVANLQVPSRPPTSVCQSKGRRAAVTTTTKAGRLSSPPSGNPMAFAQNPTRAPDVFHDEATGPGHVLAPLHPAYLSPCPVPVICCSFSVP